MDVRRIETKASKTADLTCACRAISSLEKDILLKSDDWVAPLLLPRKFQLILKSEFLRARLAQICGPKGMYAWVVARTKYIDDWFVGIAREGFKQVLILGAGFDTRAIRFADELSGARVFELDAGSTQIIKTTQFKARGINLPDYVTFLPVNFELETITEKLKKAGFRTDLKTLIVMEGVLQYIRPGAVRATLSSLSQLTPPGSRLICDFANASFFQTEVDVYGKTGMQSILKRYGETFQFGVAETEVEPFFDQMGFRLVEYITPPDLEQMYFKDTRGKVRARVNGTQSIITAERY